MAFNSFRSSADDAPDRALREIVTPEGVAITVRLADRGERVAALIAIGAVAMFLIAGVLEGFARQVVDDTWQRYAVAVIMLTFWAVYFTLSGKDIARDGIQ